MSSPSRALLDRAERATWVLGVAAVALSGLLWQGRGMLGAAAGAFIGGLNLRALRFLATRMFALLSAGAASPSGARPPGHGVGGAGRLVLLSTVKLLALAAAVYLAIGPLGLPFVPFALGISGFVLALVGLGLTTRLP